MVLWRLCKNFVHILSKPTGLLNILTHYLIMVLWVLNIWTRKIQILFSFLQIVVHLKLYGNDFREYSLHYIKYLNAIKKLLKKIHLLHFNSQKIFLKIKVTEIGISVVLPQQLVL